MSGSGKINKAVTARETIELKIKAAKLLKKEGFSIRAIMQFMNYKSPRAVQYLLEK